MNSNYNNSDCGDADDISIRSVSIRNESDDNGYSSGEGENNFIIRKSSNKKRGESIGYEIVEEYENIADAMKYLNKDFLVANNLKKSTSNVSSSKNCVHNYCCKLKECPLRYRLVKNNSDEKVLLQKSVFNHDHENVYKKINCTYYNLIVMVLIVFILTYLIKINCNCIIF